MKKITFFLLALFLFACNNAATSAGVDNSSPIITADSKINWAGKYYFEATNKDDLKTSFDINIADLKNITLVYVGDGEKPETYKKLKGESVSENKIKIIFNKSYEGLGEIYLEKVGKDYYISGEAIYYINPGSDKMLIKKKV